MINSHMFAPSLLEHNRLLAGHMITQAEAGNYCVVLGPPYSGKTALLQYAKERLAQDPIRTCIYVDLRETKTVALSMFFSSLARITAEAIAHYLKVRFTVPRKEISNGSGFGHFLQNAAARLNRDLIFMADHL